MVIYEENSIKQQINLLELIACQSWTSRLALKTFFKVNHFKNVNLEEPIALPWQKYLTINIWVMHAHPLETTQF